MTHLTPEEFVDLVDGALAPSRAGHAASCAECRAQASAMHATLREAAALDVPEPPPFFWDRFTARTRDAVAAAAPDRGWRVRLGASWIAVAAAAVVAIAAFAGARLVRGPEPAPQNAAIPAPAGPRDPAVVRGIDDVFESSNTEAWELVVAAAADMEFDEAHDAGMTPHPGAIDLAVGRMSEEERVALAELLQSELKRAGD
jgi:hypothetical protein